MIIWGLDCPNPACFHDGRHGFRLDFWMTTGHVDPATGQRVWTRERNPSIFREGELIPAKDQLVALGAPPEFGDYTLEADRTTGLPPGMIARRVRLSRILLPRTAVYFRWRPEMGVEQLTPHNTFQCLFMPGATAQQRRCAPERRVTEEEFTEVIAGLPAPNTDPARGLRTSVSKMRCQHCHQPLPLRQFNALTLREVEKGD